MRDAARDFAPCDLFLCFQQIAEVLKDHDVAEILAIMLQRCDSDFNVEFSALGLAADDHLARGRAHAVCSAKNVLELCRDRSFEDSAQSVSAVGSLLIPEHGFEHMIGARDAAFRIE